MPVTPVSAVRPRRRWWRRVLGFGASVVGAIFIGGLGWKLADGSLVAGQVERKDPRVGYLVDGFAESLARLSYDLPFILRGPIATPEACVVFLDEKSATALGQTGDIWDRALHTQLLRRLTQEGARLVLFDIVFKDAWPVAGVDEAFAAAMQENGRVVIGSALEQASEVDGVFLMRQQRAINPTPVLRRAAAGVGLLAFVPVDGDYSVRRIYTGLGLVPTATWRAALQLGAPLPDVLEERTRERWLNYYGPPEWVYSLGMDRALQPGGIEPGFFRDKIVCIGGRATLDTGLLLGRDEFLNPWSRIGESFSRGVEVHLTVLLNLLRGDWLTRLDPAREQWLIVLFGAALGGLLPLLRPHLAALVAGLSIAALVVGAYLLFVREHTWYAWCIPAFVQTPLALGWAMGARYFLEERRRKQLRRAFAHYLSPQMADRIADAQIDLEPGGSLVEVSVMFTDLEGFTALSEKLNDPELVSRVLIDYFTQTTGHILEGDGTIIKFIGDAVLAVWNAPVPDPEHPRTAVRAAWRLHEASGLRVNGEAVRTRVGLHTGIVLAGNLGSAQRFDYTVIGDTVNFASRLEGLNKYFGTNVLISDATRQRIGDAFLTRSLGEIQVSGKFESVTVHELLGPAPANPPPWLETFARALAAFRTADFSAAQHLFREVCAERGGHDGPAAFYLAQIAALSAATLPSDWQGVVKVDSK